MPRWRYSGDVVESGGEKWETKEKQGLGSALPSVSDVPGPTFMGRFAHTVDDKRRVAIPKSFREELKTEANPTLYLIPSVDPCLWLQTEPRFHAFKARIAEMSARTLGVGDEAIRTLKREIFSRGGKVSPDKQGRIVLPPELCATVGIDKDVVFLGVDEHIELWSPAAEQLRDDPERLRRLSKEILG